MRCLGVGHFLREMHGGRADRPQGDLGGAKKEIFEMINDIEVKFGVERDE